MRALRERIVAVPTERMHLWLMLVLTFTTGVNDAVGYLGLGKVFTGNMTGNVVVLGMALVGGSGLPVLGPALALLGFMTGAAIAGRTLKRADRSWHGRTTAIFGLVAFLMLALGLGLLLVDERTPSRAEEITVTTIAALAMGLQAAAARLVAVKDVTTVVVTSTITGLAADSYFGSGKGGGTARRAIAVLAIIAGAVAGAALLKWHTGAGLLLAGVVIALATWIGDLHDRAHR